MSDDITEKVILLAQAEQTARLVAKKNEAYGSAFEDCTHFLKLLYPIGVPPKDYQPMLTLVRIFDKMKRIATDPEYGGEEPWRDINGYSLLELMLQEKRKKEQETIVRDSGGEPIAILTGNSINPCRCPRSGPTGSPSQISPLSSIFVCSTCGGWYR